MLYLPGAAGSKSQARSFASEAYRQYSRAQTTNLGRTAAPFTIYTVHFNEEHSAHDGRLVTAQARFVIRSLEWLYDEHQLTLAVLVGHSMGVLWTRCVALVRTPCRIIYPIHLPVSRRYRSASCAVAESWRWRMSCDVCRLTLRDAASCIAALGRDAKPTYAAERHKGSALPVNLSGHT